jgi:hypothetical protein
MSYANRLFRPLLLLRLRPLPWFSYFSSTVRTIIIGLKLNASLLHPLKIYIFFLSPHTVKFSCEGKISNPVRIGYPHFLADLP